MHVPCSVGDGCATSQVPVLCEYVMPWEKIEDIQSQPLQSDRFVWRWTESGQYSASSAYRSFFVGMSSLLGAKDIWRSTVPPKVKFFFWLAIHGGLWAVCALCDQDDETTDHLLTACVFAREVWYCLLRAVGLQQLTPQHSRTRPCLNGGSRLDRLSPARSEDASTP